MTISIAWGTRVISVPKADMTLIQASPVEIRELNLNEFRLILKDLEDGEDGMPHPDTHRHNTEVSLGGLTFARVIEIINGYTVTFEDGQYAVNLVGANSNVGDVVNVNQVSVRSYNSAGLISNPAIEYASFNGGVTVDVLSSNTGTIYPTGTPQQPVNNMEDALLIAQVRGFTHFYINGDLTISIGDYSEYAFSGQSHKNTLITIESAADMVDCEFYDATITGILDGNCVLCNCEILDLEYIAGEVHQCLLGQGTIILYGNAVFLDCWSGVPDYIEPIIDLGGSGAELDIRNYNGAIKLTNKTGSEAISIDLNSGRVLVDSSVTNGELVVRGIGWVQNNGTGTFTCDCVGLVNVENIVEGVEASDSITTLLSFLTFVKEIEGGKWEISGDQMIFYQDDNITEIARFDITYDVDGNPIMRTRV